MRIVILQDAAAVASFGAEQLITQVHRKPTSVLGLATGSSPVQLYQELIQAVQAGQVSFADVTSFNLDEYLGLAAEHPQSYRHFMNRQLFDQIDIRPGSSHVLDGLSTDPVETCTAYETLIQERGGIDWQLLGIGRNGHIGFNEPSSSLVSRTRVKTLTEDTVLANRRFFQADEFQPHLALTLGIGTIMEARQIVLIATGADKAHALQQAIEGPVSAHCPASILQMHANATLVIDDAAAQSLADIAFYQYIERERQRLLNATQA